MRNQDPSAEDLKKILLERIHDMKDFLKESPLKLSPRAITQLNLILLTLGALIPRNQSVTLFGAPRHQRPYPQLIVKLFLRLQKFERSQETVNDNILRELDFNSL